MQHSLYFLEAGIKILGSNLQCFSSNFAHSRSFQEVAWFCLKCTRIFLQGATFKLLNFPTRTCRIFFTDTIFFKQLFLLVMSELRTIIFQSEKVITIKVVNLGKMTLCMLEHAKFKSPSTCWTNLYRSHKKLIQPDPGQNFLTWTHRFSNVIKIIQTNNLSIYLKMGVQMFVCLLACGGLMEIQTPALILMTFCTHISHLSKEGFGANMTPPPPLPGPGGLETL